MTSLCLAGIRLLLLGLALVIAPAPAAAQRKWALVVGNDGYREVPELRKARADARSVGDVLKRVGFDVAVATDVDFARFNRELSDFAGRVGQGDTALFFFAGHGFAIENRNYLLPIDVPAAGPGQGDLVRRASIPTDEVTSTLRGRGAKIVVAILDACRDNPFAVPGKRSLAGGRGLARPEAVDGEFVLMAAGANQAALDRLGDRDPDPNSVFTRVLLREIVEPGSDLVAVSRRIRERVRDLAAQLNHLQTPAYADDGAGTLIFVPKGTEVVINPNQESVFWQSAERGNTRADYESYLEKVRSGEFKGTFERLATTRLAALLRSEQETRSRAEAEERRQAQDQARRERLREVEARGPRRLVTEGYNGPLFVRGSFTRTGPGEWTEQNTENRENRMRFETVEQTEERILLHDAGRNMYLELDLKARATRWRLGRNGNWNKLYAIMRMER